MTCILFCDHSKRREDWERSIFVRLKEGGYRLQENILFHLYVSTSPCGDARLNSPYEITTDCKRKYFPLFFSPLCLLLLICLFILRLILLSLLTDLQKIFFLKAETLKGIWHVCLCSWCSFPHAERENHGQAELEFLYLPEAPWLCWVVPNSLRFLMGKGTPVISRHLGKGPHDQTDSWSHSHGLD